MRKNIPSQNAKIYDKIKKLKKFLPHNPTVQPYYILNATDSNLNIQQCTPAITPPVNLLSRPSLRQSGLWNVMCAVRASSSSSASPVAR